ncbi:MAG: hypothetical protein PWP06_600 [Candidatus Marinimicrobia bacterium]|jgi:hypothetical protein|nr:hypothetical protein [Candidatus Neomarinimicrobiota bacterium]
MTEEKDKKKAMTDKIARAIVRRGMSVPAVFFMQTFKPMNFIGSQTVVFFGPVLESLFPRSDIYGIAEFMEERENVEQLMERIEALESERGPEPEKKERKRRFFKKAKRKE